MIEPLDSRLEMLLSAERGRAEDLGAERAQALAAVTAILSGPGPVGGGDGGGGAGPAADGGAASASAGTGTGAASGLAGLLSRPLTCALLGLAVGAGGGSAVTAAIMASDTPAAVTEAAPPEEASPPEAVGPAEELDQAGGEVPPAPADPDLREAAEDPAQRRSGSDHRTVRSEVAAESPPPRTTDLEAERQLVERARTALARRRPQAALLALMEHERRFPGGMLAEERDSLTVQALRVAGRPGQARARAERFVQEHPESILAPVVEEAVGDGGPGD